MWRQGIKILSAFWTLSGLHMIVSPQTALSSWQNNVKLNRTTSLLLQSYGYYLLSIAAANSSIQFLDDTPAKAVGYGSIVYGFMHGIHLLDVTYKQLGIPQGSQAFWLLIHIALMATVLH